MTFGAHNKKYKASSRDYEYAKKILLLAGFSNETKMKIGKKSKNRIVSKETREKISKQTKGKLRSEKTKKRISEAKKLKNNNFFRGSVITALIEKYGEELGNEKIKIYKDKLRLVNTGRKHSDKTKEKLSISSHKRKYIHCKYCNKRI